MELSKQFLRTNKPRLVEYLRVNSNLTLQGVHAKGILTDREYGALRDIADHDKVNQSIIDNVYDKGDKTCAKFLHMLKDDAEIQETVPQLGKLLSSWRETPGENVSHASGGGRGNVTGGISGACASDDASAKIPDKLDFFQKSLCRLNNGVTEINSILDYLGERKFSKESTALVNAQPTPQAQMRKIINLITTKKLAGHLFDALVKYQEDLMEELVEEYLNKNNDN